MIFHFTSSVASYSRCDPNGRRVLRAIIASLSLTNHSLLLTYDSSNIYIVLFFYVFPASWAKEGGVNPLLISAENKSHPRSLIFFQIQWSEEGKRVSVYAGRVDFIFNELGYNNIL